MDATERAAGAGGRSSQAGGNGSGPSSSAAPQQLPPEPAPLVFLSHTGEQKKGFVDFLHTLLEAYDVDPVFLDEHSLEAGTYNEPAMMAAVGAAPVGERFFLGGGGRCWARGLKWLAAAGGRHPAMLHRFSHIRQPTEPARPHASLPAQSSPC